MRICNVMSGMQPSFTFCDLLVRLNGSGDLVAMDSSPEADLYVYWRGHMAQDVKHPSVNYVHCDLTDDMVYEFGYEAYKDIKAFDYYLCINYKQRADLMDWGISPDRIKVIHHGYDPELLSVVRQPSDKIRIGFYSHRYTRLVKGEMNLYAMMWNELRDYRDNIEWHWLGENRYVEHMTAKELGYSSKLLNPIDYQDVIKSYENLDIQLILSVAEGGPMSFPEAIAAGACVISTPVGMVPDFGYGMKVKDLRDYVVALVSRALPIPSQEEVRTSAVLPTWDEQMNKYKEFYASILS